VSRRSLSLHILRSWPPAIEALSVFSDTAPRRVCRFLSILSSAGLKLAIQDGRDPWGRCARGTYGRGNGCNRDTIETLVTSGVALALQIAIRSGAIDVVLLGRPALANAHWPVWPVRAARELGHAEPFDLVPRDWGWWLKHFRGYGPSVG
jgi:hypothetical protein